MPTELHENVIEWIDGEDTVSVTLHQKRYITKVRRLAVQDERVQILNENKDGSIFAHLPLEMVKLEKKRIVRQTQEQKEAWGQKMKMIRESKTDTLGEFMTPPTEPEREDDDELY